MKSHTYSGKQSADANLLPSCPQNTTCEVCSKVCKSKSGLQRHMVVHKYVTPQIDPINSGELLGFVCHVCSRPCKSLAGLKNSSLWRHVKKIELTENMRLKSYPENSEEQKQQIEFNNFITSCRKWHRT